MISKTTVRIAGCVAATLLWVLAPARPGDAAQGVGAATVSVVPSRGGDIVQEFAAQQLQQYLHTIGGAPVAVGPASAPHHVFLGDLPPRVSAAQAGELRAEVERLSEDGFLIRSLGPDVVILGKGSRGVLYGAYAFLEQEGVRWYFPGKQYEIVPHHPLAWNPSLKIAESPAFPKRILFYWPNNYSSVDDWIDFCAKVRLNRVMFHYTWPAMDWYLPLQSRLLPELRQRGLEIEVGGHFLSTFLPRTLFPQHPDWFRRNEQGVRVNDFNLNPFNQEALNYLADGATDYLSKMPEASLFHLWADDISDGGWSHESGKESYTPSDQALLVSNYLVKKLRERLPHANLAYLAYKDTVYPTQVVKPEAGLVYFYAPRERCYGHALNDPACDLNRKYAAALEKGLPAFEPQNAEVFEYYADEILYENMTNPPLTEVLSGDMRYYRQLGIPAVGALMTNTSNFVTPMANMFLYPQALWNPERNLTNSLDEYATLYFGDAHMRGYFRDLAQGLGEVLKVCHYERPGDAWDGLRVDQEPDGALAYHIRGLQDALEGPLAHAATTLDRAARASKGKRAAEHFAGEQISMKFTLLQARLYFHLLQGERLYREWKSAHDQDAGLGALTELALARHTWDNEKSFIATSGMKGNPLMPSTRPLEDRAAEMLAAITQAPASVVGVNGAGFGMDVLAEHLLNGVSGYMLSGPTGSRAVLWTDVAPSRSPLRIGQGLAGHDEFGRPVKVEDQDLRAAPVVIDAAGFPAYKLFDALFEG
jgi:hypothetical protein